MPVQQLLVAVPLPSLPGLAEPTKTASSLHTTSAPNIASKNYRDIYQAAQERPNVQQTMYGLNPFAAQDATKDPSHPPSIFGALPYPGSAAALPHTLVTLRFTSLNTTVLDCKVVGPTNETVYRVVTEGRAYTLLKDRAGRDLAIVGWETHPTVEGKAIEKQRVGQWLQLSADKRARTMVHGEVRYSWAPFDRFLHLFASDSSSEWLVRVTRNADAVVLELTPRAIERGLMDVAVLATILLQSGKRID